MKIFNHPYRFLFILLLTVYSYANTLFSEVYFYYQIPGMPFMHVAFLLCLTLLIWEGNRIIGNLLRKKYADPLPLRFFLIFFFTGSLFAALISLLSAWVTARFFISVPSARLGIALRLSFTYGTRINLFLHVVNGILFYIRQLRHQEKEAAELKRINTQIELQEIKNQINPHFLFNNLNVLSALVMQEHQDANRFIEAFSAVYRHILSSQQQELIQLKTELSVIEPYIFLLKKRFPESILIDIQIPDSFLSFYIIPVAVQMLIENAIKHNVALKSKPLQIQLSIVEPFRLRIANNVQPKTADHGNTRIGLENIARRYQLTTGKEIEVIHTADEFIVLLPLISPIDESHHSGR